MLEKIDEFVQKCVCCGFCNSVCPVFDELGCESVSARGKLAIISELIKGNIKPSKRLKEILSLCLCCNTCGNHCPNDIPVSEIIAEARNKLKLSIFEDIVFEKVLNSNSILDLAMSTSGLFQDKFFNKGKTGMNSKIDFSLFNIPKNRLVPRVSHDFFSRKYFQEIIRSHNEKHRILFFPGCMVNYLYPELGEAMVDFLTDRHTTVIIPKALKCCGLPAYVSGKFSAYKKLKEHNDKILKHYRYDYIITLCPSCSTILKDIHDETKSSISNKVLDISEFIMKKFDNELKLKSLYGKVTYHASCHMKNIQKIIDEPLEILKNYKDKFVLPSVDQCCGFGGTFSIKHYDISNKLSLKRIDTIKQTKANNLIVSCPACMMHLKDAVKQQNMNISVRHIIEIL